jgi:FKBP-type peptidyl-prolyl cis-trans isomerase FkpA
MPKQSYWKIMRIIIIALVATLMSFSSIAGAVKTDSGLSYIVIKEGRGKYPKSTSSVTVHYKGTLEKNGVKFDSSYDRGKPSTFRLNQVIRGWTEGVQFMREGSIYRFKIPPYLAYGQRGSGRSVGPNETLIFDIELIKVN